MTRKPEDSSPITGGCRCGAVRFEVNATALWSAHCHCADCRHATGAAFATYVGVASDKTVFSGEFTRYESSPGVFRSFCPGCGSPLAFEGEKWAGELHLFAGALDAPEDISPAAHVMMADAMPWIELADELPRFHKFVADDTDGGG